MYLMNDQGLFEPYDDNYDVVIHCDSEEARDEVIADLKAINEGEDVIDKTGMLYDIYMKGVNMTGNYKGCWVRFKDIEKIVNKYIESEKIKWQ